MMNSYQKKLSFIKGWILLYFGWKKITSFQTSENKYLNIHTIILKLQDILNDIADDTEIKTKNKIYTMFDSKKNQNK